MHSCHSCGFYFYRFSIDLDKSRELEIGIYWRDWRSLCAIKFLRLEEFIDDIRHGMALQLEPQGLLFAEVINPAQCKSILCNFVAIYCLFMCSHLIKFVTFITSSTFWLLSYDSVIQGVYVLCH